MSLKCHHLSAVAIAAAIGIGGTLARASSVSIDTGIANWRYNYTTSTADQTPTGGAAPTGAAAPLIASPSANWLSATTVDSHAGETTPVAQWIGSQATGGTDGYYGDYTFSLTINFNQFVPPVPDDGPHAFEVSGVVSVDNEIQLFLFDPTNSSFTPLTLTTLVDGAPGASKAYGFERVFDASGGGLLHNPFVLFAVVHNDYPASAGLDPITHINESSDNPDNAMGFIIAGSITAVPLPVSAKVGFAMLACAGLLAATRKGLRRKQKIV